jgi:hypothetical protein
MTTKDKKEFVHRVGLPVASNTTQVHAAAQQQPAQQTTVVAASAGTPIPGNEPGAILHTMLSANAAQQGRAPAGSTILVTFDGHTYNCTVTKVQYPVNPDIISTRLGSLILMPMVVSLVRIC